MGKNTAGADTTKMNLCTEMASPTLRKKIYSCACAIFGCRTVGGALNGVIRGATTPTVN